MLVMKQLPVAIDFHNIGKNTMEVDGYHQFTNILQIKSEIKKNLLTGQCWLNQWCKFEVRTVYRPTNGILNLFEHSYCFCNCV